MTTDSANTHFETCPICFSPIQTWRVKQVRDKSYTLDLCNSCGFCFVNPRPSLRFLMEYYSSFGHDHNGTQTSAATLESVLAQEKAFPNSTIDAKRLISTVQSLTKAGRGSKFMDIGSGYGFFSKEAMNAGFEVTALELAKNEREITEELTGISPIACSYEEFECPPESLQVVLMSQILEHAYDVNLWIKKAHDSLTDGGIIAIALPNFGSIFRLILQENESFICPPAHLNFFSPNSLSKLLENHGFEVESIQWVSRIPKAAFEKRLPQFGKPLVPLITAVSSASLGIIDAVHLGMMLNIYARKTSA